ncbi:MAG: hypothetical protein FDZ69_13600 [Deltaproteobacteria bacterium]|nr:MAG: hypothetical protein FDZ69_13600 [Deltaproteobacteria bacterium]
MTIHVELIDGCCVQVVPRGLDLLLERNLVRRFLRGSGWAVIGVDPIRRAPCPAEYHGLERRRQLI